MRIRTLLRAGAILLLILLLGIFGYNTGIQRSIQREERERLVCETVQRLRAPVERAGDPNRPAILLLHGFGGSPHDLHPLIQAIPDGYALHAPLLPGHAAPTPRALAATRWTEWRSAAFEHARELKAEHAGVIVCGFSLGGLLALDLAMEREVEAVILINPYTTVPYHPAYVFPVRYWTRWTRHVAPYVRKISAGRIKCERGRNEYEPGYMHVSQQGAHTLQQYSARIRRQVQRRPVRVPVFLHISEQDVVSDPKRMRNLAVALDLASDRVRLWARSNHVLLHDYDGPAAVEAMLDQIESAAPMQPSPRQ